MTIWKDAHVKDDSDWIPDQDRVIMTKEDDASTSDSNTGTDGGGHGDSECDQVRQIKSENEFGDTELEDLVKIEGPQEILCRNPSLGLATKAKGITRVRAKRKPGS
jgi:hypothetical protein